jgi:CMP-N,N'-diacetyllegionaminic acid synthase
VGARTRVLGVVPARGGSKGIPGKNIAPLGGRPLVAWTAEAALASSLARTVLSTDDEAIAAAGRAAGLDVPFLRPAELAGDRAESIDVVLHALDAVEPTDGPYDAVMLLQPTTPLRTAADIDAAIELLERTGADAVISVADVGGHHPARMKWLEGDRLIDPPFAEEVENQPRQTLRPVFIRNGAIYLTRVEVLRRRSFKGEDCRALVMPDERSVNIDTPFDLAIARAVVEGAVVARPGDASAADA